MGTVREDLNVYEDAGERRTLDLRPDGILCIPVLGQSSFLKRREGTDEHVHPGCLEICLCLRGRLFFESKGTEYPFFPGTIFVSQPREAHRMRNNPKGLRMQRILFAYPEGDRTVLGLSREESKWLVGQLRHFPIRLFPATTRVREAFARLFFYYDHERRGTLARRLKLKAAVLELLLALVEAPHAKPSGSSKINLKVSAIVRRMKENPDREYSVEALTKESALSTVAFNEAFKRVAGLPPHAYLLDLRVRAAEKELADGSRSVAAVAARYHFSSPQHLASVFRSVLGRAPRRIK